VKLLEKFKKIGIRCRVPKINAFYGVLKALPQCLNCSNREVGVGQELSGTRFSIRVGGFPDLVLEGCKKDGETVENSFNVPAQTRHPVETGC
jgi:hypothetical protein